MKTFEEQQQELVDKFKEKLKDASKDVISEFYTDVSLYAEVDAHMNFEQKLRNEIYVKLVHEIKSKNSHYSWASSIRMALLRDHKEELQNKIIEDLQSKIESLENQINDLINRRY